MHETYFASDRKEVKKTVRVVLIFFGARRQRTPFKQLHKNETRIPHKIPMPALGSNRKWLRSHTWAEIFKLGINGMFHQEEHAIYTYFDRHIRFDDTFLMEVVLILWRKLKWDYRLNFQERVTQTATKKSHLGFSQLLKQCLKPLGFHLLIWFYVSTFAHFCQGISGKNSDFPKLRIYKANKESLVFFCFFLVEPKKIYCVFYSKNP